MGITAIKWVVNNTNEWVYYRNRENFAQTKVMPPNGVVSRTFSWPIDTWIPWCTSQGDFDNDHFIEIGGLPLRDVSGRREFAMWQHNRWFKDGDRVRFSRGGWMDIDRNWMSGGDNVDGGRGLFINALSFPPQPPPGDTSLELKPSGNRPTLESPIPLTELQVTELGGETNDRFVGSQLLLPPNYTVPTSDLGFAAIAWYAGPSLPNNNDAWFLSVYPDGPRPYPGVRQNEILCCFLNSTGQPKTINIVTAAWVRRARLAMLDKNYRIGWQFLSSGESFELEKYGDVHQENLLWVDSAALYRVFGGKVIVFDWVQD